MGGGSCLNPKQGSSDALWGVVAAHIPPPSPPAPLQLPVAQCALLLLFQFVQKETSCTVKAWARGSEKVDSWGFLFLSKRWKGSRDSGSGHRW